MNVARVVALLKDLEGWRDYVYDDRSPWPRTEVARLDCREVAGQYKVNATGGTATVGYGETSADFIDRYWGRRITQPEALAKMAERVQGFFAGVRKCITADLTQHQWEAVTCRAYQTGAGGFCRSETAALLNAGDIGAALARWREEFAHSGRSEVEIAHFLTPDEEAQPMKFVSRSEWGARAVNLTGLDSDMVSVHWVGPKMGTPAHSACAGIVRGIQRQHMDVNGWVAEAYNAFACPHGYVFEGRGRGKRSAANGTSAANSASYAICYLGGEGDPFTNEGRDAINDAAEWLVASASRRWGVHRDWVATACPGESITSWVRAGHPRSAGSKPNPVPAPEEEDMALPIFGDSPPEREYAFWMIDGAFRQRLHTTEVWDQYVEIAKKAGTKPPTHIGAIPLATFDALVNLDDLRRPAPVEGKDVDGLDPQAVADLVVAKLGAGLAREVGDLLAERLAN